MNEVQHGVLLQGIDTTMTAWESDALAELQASLHQSQIALKEKLHCLLSQNQIDGIKRAHVQSVDQAPMENQDQFILTLVHDLRLPVLVAKIHSQLITRTPNDPDLARKAAAKVIQKLDQLETMLREILDASQVRAGTCRAPERAEVQLNEIVRQVVQDMTDTHGSRIIVNEDETISGRWSASGVRRLVENLIINALKYGAPETQITVTVRSSNRDALILVHNYGNPIPVDHQKKLFDRNSRCASGISKSGWGLGLSFVQAMVEEHQGTIEVSSSADEGTEFHVRLPKNN